MEDASGAEWRRVETANPNGNSQNPQNLTANQIQSIKSNLTSAKKVPSGVWLLPSSQSEKDCSDDNGSRSTKNRKITEQSQEWPLPQIGIEIHGGRLLSNGEIQAICALTEINLNALNVDGIEIGESLNPEFADGQSESILRNLFIRGCSIRSGFKYGTKWRVYAGVVGDGHAPWLILPLHAAPLDWAGACLAARLAAVS